MNPPRRLKGTIQISIKPRPKTILVKKISVALLGLATILVPLTPVYADEEKGNKISVMGDIYYLVKTRYMKEILINSAVYPNMDLALDGLFISKIETYYPNGIYMSQLHRGTLAGHYEISSNKLCLEIDAGKLSCRELFMSKKGKYIFRLIGKGTLNSAIIIQNN